MSRAGIHPLGSLVICVKPSHWTRRKGLPEEKSLARAKLGNPGILREAVSRSMGVGRYR